MRSGLFDFEDDPSLLGDLDAHLRPHSLEEVVRLGIQGPPLFELGERYTYCNTNFCVLEAIIQHVTGRTLDQELRDRGLRATRAGRHELSPGGGPDAAGALHPWV